jgi:hypothetical protein
MFFDKHVVEVRFFWMIWWASWWGTFLLCIKILIKNRKFNFGKKLTSP